LSSLRFLLGGLDLAVSADEEVLPPEGDAYRPFVSDAERAAGPETVQVRVLVTGAPRAEGRVIFESEAHWSMLRGEDGRRSLVDRDASGPVLAVHFDPASTDVLVECSPAWRVEGPPPAVRCPVRYPVDQILAMYLLGRRGLVVHAAGFRVRGRAVVLPGVSGAGKTTFARLARGREDWKALSDDRIIVGVPDGVRGAVAHGTPWPGEGRVASNDSGPLERLAFLVQGSANAWEPLSPAQAATRLLATTSVPWYDPDHLGLTLDACDRLVDRVPAGLLTFRPDDGAPSLVERLLDLDGSGPTG
jgi:hypothetical protein